MVSARKRGHQEMETVEAPEEPTTLERIRNMWQFANLVQWIYMFGKAVKIDEDLDIEDLEMECLKSHSTVLPEIGLALLKFVSSHRGLTPEIFEEYTRRQYVAKAPERNPFGTGDEPAKFTDFDVFTKIKVLQQLTQWTMGNPDRIRERMEDSKDTEMALWRIEDFGWDDQERTYIVLDDNRLYRRTDPPPPPQPAAKLKKNSKKAKAAQRASKRRKVSQAAESEVEPEEEDADADGEATAEKEDDGLGGVKWECVAVTLDELNDFIKSLGKGRDLNEKTLKKDLVENLLPLLEKQEEARKRKQHQKERELLNLEKLATAKRSSRIAGKLEHQKQEEEVREAERKKQTDLAMARKEQEKWNKLEKERESRMMTREQRVKEREARRILHEEELANLSEDSKKLDAGASAGRLSERHLKAEIEKKKAALEELAEEEDWIFDCICGAYGQIDDGTHSIACDKCNIWQHSKCVGVREVDADQAAFHFICKTCERREKDAERAKTHPPIKIKFSRPGSSSSSMTPKLNGSPALPSSGFVNGSPNVQASPQKIEQTNGRQLAPWQSNVSPPQMKPATSTFQNGSQQPRAVPSAYASNAADKRPHCQPYGSPYGSGTPYQPQSSSRPSSSHAFSPPHPYSPTNLPPPGQHQSYSFGNGNGHPPPPSWPTNGQHPQTQDTHRRSSMSMPSPLSGAPALTPIQKAPSMATFSTSSSPPTAKTQIAQPQSPQSNKVSHPYAATPIQASQPQSQDPSQASTLPPASTGFSPTKHSPPRPTTANGSFGSATPSTLPPVASLSPSPRLQNPSPPVKASEPNPLPPAQASTS